MRSTEDFILVLLQNVDPRTHIRSVLFGVVRNSPFHGKKNARQFSSQFLLRIADIAEPVSLVESRAIQS